MLIKLIFISKLYPRVIKYITMSFLEKNHEKYYCCECGECGEYNNLQHAYENGWYQNDCLSYCSNHALAAMEKEDKSWERQQEKNKF